MNKQRFLDVVPIQQCDPTLPHWVCTVVNKAMMLDVARRYQSPAAMLADLAIAERQLIEGGDAVSAEAAAAAMGTYVEAKQHTVLVVESDPKWQDIFREGFKRVNYRVLVIADPERAVARLRQDNKAAQCIVFCAQGLGEAALNGFNMLSGDERDRFRSGRALVGRAAEGLEGAGLRGRTSHRADDAHHHERTAEQAGRADGPVVRMHSHLPAACYNSRDPARIVGRQAPFARSLPC